MVHTICHSMRIGGGVGSIPTIDIEGSSRTCENDMRCKGDKSFFFCSLKKKEKAGKFFRNFHQILNWNRDLYELFLRIYDIGKEDYGI